MAEKLENPQAFPRFEDGMTLRDYFASAVVAGHCSNIGTNGWSIEKAASNAYQYADAMLKARSAQ